MRKLLALVTVISVTLSGCAMGEGDFPSLQKRPYEDVPAIAESPAQPATAAALPDDLQRDLDAAVARSRAAHARYLARLPAVRQQVDAARGAAVSSERWVVAQMELAALEIERSPSVEALADIDAIYRTQLESDSGGTALVAGQREAVQAQVDAQQSTIDALKSRLR